jgi:hypothetical protein
MTEISAPCFGVPVRRVGNRTHVLLLALTLVALLFGAFSSSLVAKAHAAPIVVIDENGANDVPGQKDLTSYSVDDAGLPASLAVTWNWDDISWSGSNTGDACALFDTNANALVDYALCVTVGDSPASALSTRLYSCGDDAVDRCSQPVSEIPISDFSSTCSVSTTSNDPFPTGAASPQDTSASCNVVMSDFGLTNAVLINTCSYPSQEPNSAPSDCVLVPRDGFLIIQKNAVPDDANAQFDFSLDGNAAFTAHGTETSQIIGVRSDITHSLSETMPSLWALQSASCSPTTGTTSGDGITGISVGAGQTVTCTFNNAFSKDSPTISTQGSPTVVVGGDIYDTATLAGGFNPTGTITFDLYAPDDTFCTSSIYTTSATVTGNGSYVAPTIAATAAGTYRWIASYSGDANNNTVSGACNDANESVVVSKKSPTITTTASAGVVVGSTISDIAHLSGAYNGTGTITFKLYGPNDTNCLAGAISTTTATVAGDGNYPSPAFTTTQAGTYRWIASYSGDTNNNAVSGGCNDDNESVVVDKKSPTITTTATPSAIVGNPITDTATLAGAQPPVGGSITFTLYTDDLCTVPAAPAYSSTKTVTANGSYTSDPYTPQNVGTYYWKAVYSGDTNNLSATHACADQTEVTAVDQQPTTLTTQATATEIVGNDISDTATLAGGFNPTGTITFTLYTDNQCTNAVAGSQSTKTVTANGSYTSDAVPTSSVGTYYWKAVYSGDANNAGSTHDCGIASETTTVTQRQPAISTQASDAIDVGGSIHDTATLAGGFEPTGTITFQLFGPNDTQCATVISTTSVEVDGNGNYDSADVQPTQPGAYRWIASYSGDSNNDAVSGSCTDENESVIVSKPAISLVKTVSAASVAPGETVTFTLTVTNTGDIALSNVVMTDDTCSPLSGPAGDTGSDSILDPAEVWTFTCSMAINQNTTNVATVTARDVHETTVTAQSSASVTVTPPSSPPPSSPATVRILSNNVCVSKRFRIKPRVSSGTVQSMTLYIDGKRKATGKRHSFLINTAKYKPGRHRIRVVTTLTDGQRIITNGSFKRCGIKTTQRRVTPKFTG